MKFAVMAWSTKGRARVGSLQWGSCLHPVETPALLLTLVKGRPFTSHLTFSPPFLPLILFYFSVVLFTCISLKTISYIGGLHEMLCLREYAFVAVPRDSVVCLPECNSSNKIGASFETPSGCRLIKPGEYMEMISSMKPNVWTTLADEVPVWVLEKRNKASVDRTVRWLDDCIRLK